VAGLVIASVVGMVESDRREMKSEP